MASYGSFNGWKLATTWDEGNGPCVHRSGWYARDSPADEDCVCRRRGEWLCIRRPSSLRPRCGFARHERLERRSSNS
jgi:hypothetical protein